MDDPPAASEEGEARYRQLLTTSPAPINLFDADGVTVWGNEAVLDLLGLEDREALVGRPVLDFIHPDYHDVARVEIEQVIGGNEPVGPTPMELITDDGRTVSIRVSTAPGRYRGEPIGQAIVIDDTPLAEAQAVLEHQRDLVERVIDTLPDLYVMLSAEGELLDWNEKLTEVSRYAAPELQGLTVHDLFGQGAGERILRSASSLREGDRDIVNADLRTKDGRTIPYEFHGGLLTGDGNVPTRVVGIARNVGDRVERDRHLRVVDRLLRHNLRNKLNVVMGYAELARDDDVALREEDIDQVLRTCRRLLESMDKARQIVNVIVEPAAPTRLDLATILEEEAASLDEANPAATITVSAPADVVVMAIPSLRNAVAEALDNAVKHNPSAAPTVEVSVEAMADVVAVHVDDDGPPIPETEQWVFDELTEESLAHSEGLGLWFVHWVCDRSGGRVELEDHPGGGNRLTMRLPRATEG